MNAQQLATSQRGAALQARVAPACTVNYAGYHPISGAASASPAAFVAGPLPAGDAGSSLLAPPRRRTLGSAPVPAGGAGSSLLAPPPRRALGSAPMPAGGAGPTVPASGAGPSTTPSKGKGRKRPASTPASPCRAASPLRLGGAGSSAVGSAGGPAGGPRGGGRSAGGPAGGSASGPRGGGRSVSGPAGGPAGGPRGGGRSAGGQAGGSASVSAGGSVGGSPGRASSEPTSEYLRELGAGFEEEAADASKDVCTNARGRGVWRQRWPACGAVSPGGRYWRVAATGGRSWRVAATGYWCAAAAATGVPLLSSVSSFFLCIVAILPTL